MTFSLALSAFALSLLGAAHCVAMCGGFAAVAHVRPNGEATPMLKVALHGGRIASYALIGGAISAAGTFPLGFVSSEAAHRVLFLVACVVLAATGLRMVGLKLPGSVHSPWTRRIGLWATAVARRIGAPRTGLRAFALGALWGWAPCALVYGALPLALVSGSFASGAIVMAAFGVGTLPALAGGGWLLSHWAKPRARAWIGVFVVMMAVFAGVGALAPGVLPPFLCLT